jgi:hypothetical protein
VVHLFLPFINSLNPLHLKRIRLQIRKSIDHPHCNQIDHNHNLQRILISQIIQKTKIVQNPTLSNPQIKILAPKRITQHQIQPSVFIPVINHRKVYKTPARKIILAQKVQGVCY